MPRNVTMAFDPAGKFLPLKSLLPLRKVSTSIRNAEKYKCIAASLREVGLIEPLIVYPQPDGVHYAVLDGTIRLDILKSQNVTDVFCLVSSDDEGYTYNHKVNQLSAIQEHFMIMKAIECGVREERIATTLNVDVAAIRQKMNLLSGICPEAVSLLKNKDVSASALREIKRVVPMRQIEMAELMVSAHNYATSYAKCLYVATPPEQRLPGETSPDKTDVSPEDQARMEREMSALRRSFKTIQDTHGDNCLHLQLASSYLKKLLNNGKIVRYLSQRHAEILAEFQKIIEAPDLDSDERTFE